jgi:hypothetical protein
LIAGDVVRLHCGLADLDALAVAARLEHPFDLETGGGTPRGASWRPIFAPEAHLHCKSMIYLMFPTPVGSASGNLHQNHGVGLNAGPRSDGISDNHVQQVANKPGLFGAERPPAGLATRHKNTFYAAREKSTARHAANGLLVGCETSGPRYQSENASPRTSQGFYNNRPCRGTGRERRATDHNEQARRSRSISTANRHVAADEYGRGLEA